MCVSQLYIPSRSSAGQLTRRRVLLTVGVALAVAVAVTQPQLSAEDPGAPKTPAEIDVTRMAALPVVLRDETGGPIAGAEVMPYAMRMREGGGHGYWNRDVYGPPKTVLSDEDGRAVIEYPIRVRVGPDILTTRLVTFQVTHADFVSKIVHFDLGPEEAVVALTAGCEVELSAADAERRPIEDFGVLMSGRDCPTLWAKGEGGTRRSRAVKEGTWQTMLVKPQQDGPTLFSRVLPLQVRAGQRLRFRNIPLRAGTRVRGRLSANVPRPVRGYVIATSVPLPADSNWADENPSIIWQDWAPVQPDGTFEFESLPKSGQLQLIAVCDGWLSTTRVDEPVARSQVMGQVFDIEGDEVSLELEMEPTGTLELSLLTVDEKPFTEGQVSSWPNQHYLKGGATLLGQRVQTMFQIQNQLLPPDAREPLSVLEKEFPFVQDVKPDGTATLRGIPLGYRGQLVLRHDRFQLAGGDERRSVSFTLKSADPVHMRLTVVPVDENRQ